MLEELLLDKYEKGILQSSNEEIYIALLEKTRKMAVDKVATNTKKALLYLC